MDLNETIRRTIMAGIGALSLTVEKSKDLADTLVKKGEEAAAENNFNYDQVAEQVKSFTDKLCADLKKASFEELLERVDDLTDEQRAILADRLAHPLKEDESCACGEDSACGCEDGADEACCCEDKPGEASEENAEKPE